MPDMTDARLAEIEGRFKKATPGPWSMIVISALLRYWRKNSLLDFEDCGETDLTKNIPDDSGGDPEFIAAAIEDIPDLIAALREARAERDALGIAFGKSVAVQDELRAIIDKLPKTADGVPRIPRSDHPSEPDAVWAWIKWPNKNEHRLCEGLVLNAQDDGEQVEFWGGRFAYEYRRVDQCYSTREAAEAAAKGGADA